MKRDPITRPLSVVEADAKRQTRAKRVSVAAIYPWRPGDIARLNLCAAMRKPLSVTWDGRRIVITTEE
jgi:hypothetical protein